MPIHSFANLSQQDQEAIQSRTLALCEALKLEIASSVVRGDRLGATLLKMGSRDASEYKAKARKHVENAAVQSPVAAVRAEASLFQGKPARKVSARAILSQANPVASVAHALAGGANKGSPSGGNDRPKVSKGPARMYASLRLRKMKCIRRTRKFPEIEEGTDEMYVFGVKFDAGPAESAKVDPIDLGQWHDGQTRDYGSDGKKLLSVQFLRAAPFPTQAAALLTFAEHDPHGGMANFLAGLWDTVKDAAAEQMEYWFENRKTDHDIIDPNTIKDQIDDSWVGILIHMIVAGVTELVKWLKSIFEDDVFTQSIVTTDTPVLHSLDERWDADNRTPIERFNVSQYGGEYEVELFWMLSEKR